MLRIIALFYFLIFSVFINAQTAQEILKHSHDSCQAVQSGYYEMRNYMKFMSGPDTSMSSFTAYFDKLEDDSIFSSAFHFKQYYHDTFRQGVLYTGEELIRYYGSDSGGVIMTKDKWASEIQAIKHNYDFYSPLTNTKSFPLPRDSFYIDETYSFEYLGEEMVNDWTTYHIRMVQTPEYDTTSFANTLKREVHYWISQVDYIPVQYTIAYDINMQNDTMYQFERFVLDSYSVNSLESDEKISLQSIPPYITMEEYVPYEAPELLPQDTLAPIWTLYDLDSNSISLKDFRGQVVLLDFFYKACFPCIKALPALQSLHEKYLDDGLALIGIDPYDKLGEGIVEFLEKKGVTYKVVLGGKDVAKSYRVSGYPTVYIIDQDGKVVYSQVGYGDGVEEQLEEVIINNLKP